MFFRIKKSGPRRYLQIVRNDRTDGIVRQTVIATVGRLDELESSGGLASLLASGARLCDQVLLLSALDHGPAGLCSKRIGAALVFGHLWQESGCRSVLEGLLAGRSFEFAVERAVFVAVLHRLFVSGSDRDCADWMRDYDLPGCEGLLLHRFYRAMAWLGEELEAKAPDMLVPRCVKDEIEEKLFERRHDLLTDLSLVFMDTTSLSFYGHGGETLGAYGYSKDHRPDLKQMILALVMDGEGRPICTEMVPGNTADITLLLPIVDRLRHRFGIGRVCIVADRGFISRETIAELEKRNLDYILGARERTGATVHNVVLADDKPFVPLLIERERGEPQLFAKEVKVGSDRYIVCRNEAGAIKDKADRQAIITGLEAQLRKGDKALIGNSAYRRYLRQTKARSFEIDLGKLADEARYDGIFVLRTNARMTPLQAVLRYRDLLQVENLFRVAKATFDTRPIYHSSDAAIRGHVFCSFLALILSRELQSRCQKAGIGVEWAHMLRDLDRLQQATIEQGEKTWQLRTEATGSLPTLMRAMHIALPPRVRAIAHPKANQPLPKKRRGRPRRSAMPH